MIKLGDCLEGLRALPDNSVDSIVTDPPYGLKFMGKAWDYDVPPEEVWRECLRVLKPGGHLLCFAGTRTQHRMAVRIEDAGFEIRDMIAWVYGCLDEATDVLTRRGWVKHHDLDEDDEVMQWDSESGGLSWVSPSAIHEYPFDGEMVVLKNRHTHQVLTPNHRVYAKVRRHSRHAAPAAYEVLSASDVSERPAHWSVDLPLAGVLAGGEEIDADYAYLVGWWLTDAWAHGDGKACMFSQSKPKTLAKLRAALAPYGASEYVRDRGNPNHAPEHTFYLSGPVAEQLLAEFPDRALPWAVLGWSEAARRALYEGLMDGDGSRGKEGQYSEAFWAKSAERRAVFTALATTLGIRNYESPEKGAVYVNPATSTTQLQGRHRTERVRYSGIVWCVTVPTGAFVARRDGRPFITGNSGFPKSLDVSKAIDKAAGAEREVVGSKTVSRDFTAGEGEDIAFRSGRPGQTEVPVTAAATPEAQRWEGWGTALKPALEPITVARKPLVGTVAANVLAHGTGALNIDACRVGDFQNTTPSGVDRRNAKLAELGYRPGEYQMGEKVPNTPPGRWPANLIHDGSGEVVALFPESSTTGKRSAASRAATVEGTAWLADNHQSTEYTDTGSAARFFYCAKASKKDRGDGNTHPTVKPTDLMRYLCRLVTPPGGLVLDPYTGSGSTAKAAALEGFRFIGFEIDPDYHAIAERRWLAAIGDLA